MKAATRLTWEWQHNNNNFFWWYANLECKRAIAVATPRGHSFRVYTVGREFCGTKIDRVPFTTAVLTVIEIHHRSWIWRCLDRACLYQVSYRCSRFTPHLHGQVSDTFWIYICILKEARFRNRRYPIPRASLILRCGERHLRLWRLRVGKKKNCDCDMWSDISSGATYLKLP